ncbi:hypothetical protein LEMLEM_LOCUS22708 [Lemmus lemmus]
MSQSGQRQRPSQMRWWRRTPLPSTLGRQRKMDLCRFKTRREFLDNRQPGLYKGTLSRSCPLPSPKNPLPFYP